MTELVRGDVTDRPWGLTLGALALRGLTGRLVLEADGYTIAFHQGAVVHARSKDPRDAAVRIAVTNTLVSPAKAAEIVKRAAAQPERDEIEVVIEAGKLSAELSDRLRRRVIAQRTARTFSLAQGAFFVDDAPPAETASAVDIRPIIYLGAHAHMSDERLTAALAGLGGYFRLKADANVKDDIARFGFTDAEREVIATLAGGASTADLERSHPRVDRRSLLAIVYALVSALACEVAVAPTPAKAGNRARTRGKVSTPPETVPPRMRSKVNSSVSFKKARPTDKIPPLPRVEPERALVASRSDRAELEASVDSNLDAALSADPDPAATPRSTRRTDQLMAFVVVPREPAPRARPDTLDDAPLEAVEQANKRPRTPTPMGAFIMPRKPAKS
jgi:hypothetical protein